MQNVDVVTVVETGIKMLLQALQTDRQPYVQNKRFSFFAQRTINVWNSLHDYIAFTSHLF